MVSFPLHTSHTPCNFHMLCTALVLPQLLHIVYLFADLIKLSGNGPMSLQCQLPLVLIGMVTGCCDIPATS